MHKAYACGVRAAGRLTRTRGGPGRSLAEPAVVIEGLRLEIGLPGIGALRAADRRGSRKLATGQSVYPQIAT